MLAPARSAALATFSVVAGAVALTKGYEWLLRRGAGTPKGLLDSRGIHLWLGFLSGSLALWIAIMVAGVRALRALANDRAGGIGRIDAFRLGWYIASYVALLGVAVLTGDLFGLAPPVPIADWQFLGAIPVMIGAICAAPWIFLVWRSLDHLQSIRHRYSPPRATPVRGDVETLVDIWRVMERSVGALAVILANSVVGVALLRAALVPRYVKEDAFPTSQLIVFGALYTFLVAFVCVPLMMTWRAVAIRLVDAAVPLPDSGVPDETVTASRARIAALLNLDRRFVRSPVAVVAVLAPFVSALLSTYAETLVGPR